MINYQELWSKAMAAQKQAQIYAKGFSDSDVRAGGRATKANPNKEDEQWWADNGPSMVESWVHWRTTSGYDIATVHGEPAIEVPVDTELAGLKVQMYIDRVMYMPTAEMTRDNFVILDLKSGAKPPKSDLQLAFYAAGLDKAYGFRPRWGTYWLAREGTISPLIDLDVYPTEMIEDLVAQFKRARDNQIFLPNMGHCPMCSAKEHCKYRNPTIWEKSK